MGVVAHGTLNHFKHAVDVAKHIVVPESQNAVAVCFQRLRSLSIRGCHRSMLTTIDLNNETGGMTCEVDDVLLDPDLPAEMRILDGEAMTQVPPKLALGVGR